MQRLPAVAGQFYPDNPETLRKLMAKLTEGEGAPRDALGVMAPHAGYIFSGGIAGETYAGVSIPERVVILGPNHHGRGHRAAVSPPGTWLTPLGEIEVDSGLTTRILEGCPDLESDEEAHRLEHSLEVQVPFIQFLAPGAKIVPICLAHSCQEVLLKIGDDLGRVLQTCGEKVLIVASSDMTHYEPGKVAERKDRLALDRVLSLDPEGLYDTVHREGISMCGVVPAVVMLAALRRLGASEATLVRYGNSGDVTGDQGDVVGYAGVVVR